MYIYFFKKNKKKQTNCDLLPLGSLFLLGLNSTPLSLSFPSQTDSGREGKRGGATSVDSRLTGELVADLDLSPTIFERYFSYDRYIWIAVTYYVHPTGGGHIIFAFSAVRRPDAWFPPI